MKRLIPVLLGLSLAAAACGSATEEVAAGGDTTTTAPATTVTTIISVETTEVATIVGSDLPGFGSTPDPAVGLIAPTVAGTSFDGTALTIEPSDNHKVIIFFAHWCPHCQAEVENLGSYFEATPPPDHVDVVAVSTGIDPRRPNYPPSDWLTSEAWPHPVMADTEDNAMAKAFGLNAYPYWVVLDPAGTVLARTAGSLPPESVEALFSNLSQLEG